MARIVFDVSTGEQTFDGDFVPPPPPFATSADIAAAKAEIAAIADRIAAVITGPVPETERASWPTKEIAARAWLAGSATAWQTAMLQAEATQTGETVVALATKVVANADAHIAIAGSLTGFRRVWMGQVDALPPGATVDATAGLVAAARSAGDALLAQILAG